MNCPHCRAALLSPEQLVDLFDTSEGLYAVVHGASPTHALRCPCGLSVTVRGDGHVTPGRIPGQLSLVA